MTYSSQEQLIKFEDELFNLALLGLLEIEGKALWEEDQMLREQGVYDGFPNLADHEVAKIEKMLRKQERKNKVKVTLTHLAPFFSKIAVFFMVFWIGTGTVIFASADIQEALYQLIVEHHEKYTQINPDWELSSLPEGYEAFVSAQLRTDLSLPLPRKLLKAKEPLQNRKFSMVTQSRHPGRNMCMTITHTIPRKQLRMKPLQTVCMSGKSITLLMEPRPLVTCPLRQNLAI